MKKKFMVFLPSRVINNIYKLLFAFPIWYRHHHFDVCFLCILCPHIRQHHWNCFWSRDIPLEPFCPRLPVTPGTPVYPLSPFWPFSKNESVSTTKHSTRNVTIYLRKIFQILKSWILQFEWKKIKIKKAITKNKWIKKIRFYYS